MSWFVNDKEDNQKEIDRLEGEVDRLTDKIYIQKVKNKPNSYIYKLSLPSFVIDVLKIDEDNRQVKIY